MKLPSFQNANNLLIQCASEFLRCLRFHGIFEPAFYFELQEQWMIRQPHNIEFFFSFLLYFALWNPFIMLVHEPNGHFLNCQALDLSRSVLNPDMEK